MTVRLRAWVDRIRGWAAPVSSAGWVVIVLLLAGWLAGWRLGWLEGAWIAACCGVVLLIAAIFLFGGHDVEVEVEVDPQRVTVGDPAGGVLRVRNSGSRRLLSSRVELRVGRNTAVFDIPGLGGSDQHEELFVLPTTRRQVIPVGPATSVRGDPLGLLRRAVERTEPVLLYVHPKIARLDNLGAGFLRDLEGQPTTDLSNNDVAFHTLREYQPGDDRRFVHWKTTARVGTLMIRQFVDTRRSHLALLLDTRPKGYRTPDEFELAVSIAGSLGTRALLDEQDITAMSGGGPLGAADGRHLLDSLAAVELEPRGRDLVGQSVVVSRTASGVSIVVMLCGSEIALSDCRAAANRFSETTRLFIIRADLEGVTGVKPIGSATVLNVASLEEFPHLMWKVTQS